MIWIILGCLSAGAIFGYVICGRLTHNRIRESEESFSRLVSIVEIILRAKTVLEEQLAVKLVKKLLGPEKESDEQIRPQSKRTY